MNIISNVAKYKSHGNGTDWTSLIESPRPPCFKYVSAWFFLFLLLSCQN